MNQIRELIEVNTNILGLDFFLMEFPNWISSSPNSYQHKGRKHCEMGEKDENSFLFVAMSAYTE